MLFKILNAFNSPDGLTAIDLDTDAELVRRAQATAQ